MYCKPYFRVLICLILVSFVSWIILLFLSGQEKTLVEEVFNNAIDCLSDEDKKLPQVRNTIHSVLVVQGRLLGSSDDTNSTCSSNQ